MKNIEKMLTCINNVRIKFLEFFWIVIYCLMLVALVIAAIII